ncbi:hypothetical protein MSAR_20490 [Mycolicibacterium sarraceniae]|uniref:Uncharacterized protein n=2 Tax=Mycolicibacterium sarraceniae TaxID=1534348 RepID=A0A7I7SQ80_9MYCO|nr:hypothetical protein MSAR_20490 [Mycolicibacterium sarraceniae]
MLAPLIGLVLVVAAVVYVTAVVVAIAAVYGLYRLARAGWSAHRSRAAAVEHQRAQMAARAELQHRWYLAGDPRGTYGRYAPVWPRA